MNRRNLVIGLVILAILVGGYYALSSGLSGGSQATPTPTTSLDDLDNIISASGTLLPVKRANLSFKIPGQVVQVAVKVGDNVKAGDVLIRLDTAELEAALAQAKAVAAMAQANLAQLQAGASKEDLAIAQANLETARAQLAKVRAGATAEEIAIAKATLERAEAALRDAQAAYDRVKGDEYVGLMPQSQALHLATMDYQIAQARYNQVVKGATAEDIRIAEAAVAAAQAALDRVKAGARPEEIAAAQARLEQAQAGVQQAQAALSAATLVAPFAGTVAAVNVNVGEAVAPGVPVLILGDLTHLRLETDDLSETNIARVKVGQSVTVNFEALPGQDFQGKVTQIAPIASQKQGGTNYMVTIEIANLDPELRWGMTGHVEINVR